VRWKDRASPPVVTYLPLAETAGALQVTNSSLLATSRAAAITSVAATMTMMERIEAQDLLLYDEQKLLESLAVTR